MIDVDFVSTAARRYDVPVDLDVSGYRDEPESYASGEALNVLEMPSASAGAFGSVGGPAEPGKDRPVLMNLGE